MTGVEEPFPATYELEIDADLPPAGGGPLQFFYPGAMQTGGSSDLLVKVTPSSGEAWFANFAAGDYPLTAATTCPDPNVLCVVVGGAGYFVKADDPRLLGKGLKVLRSVM